MVTSQLPLTVPLRGSEPCQAPAQTPERSTLGSVGLVRGSPPSPPPPPQPAAIVANTSTPIRAALHMVPPRNARIVGVASDQDTPMFMGLARRSDLRADTRDGPARRRRSRAARAFEYRPSPTWPSPYPSGQGARHGCP